MRCLFLCLAISATSLVGSESVRNPFFPLNPGAKRTTSATVAWLGTTQISNAYWFGLRINNNFRWARTDLPTEKIRIVRFTPGKELVVQLDGTSYTLTPEPPKSTKAVKPVGIPATGNTKATEASLLDILKK